MGLDMYLNRVPKVNNLEELGVINKRLDDAFLDGKLMIELSKVNDEMRRIYDIEFSIASYMAKEDVLDEIRANREEWGNIVNLRIRVAYWRKFNALHKWMVENVQDGNDDCGSYIVTKEHLEKLFLDIKDITPESAKDKFPTANGFFFGGTDYDEYYFYNVENLKATVTFLLHQQVYESVYEYSSSW